MPLPKPRPSDNETTFIRRCMASEEMYEEFEDEKQVRAVCQDIWDKYRAEQRSEADNTEKSEIKNNLYNTKTNCELKDMDNDKREVAVYLSKFGNMDSDGDVIKKGAFKKSIIENGPGTNTNRKIQFLRHHDWTKQIGIFTKLEEDENGLFAVGRLGTSTLGEDAWRDYQDGIIREHSIGFQYVAGKNKFVKDETIKGGGYNLISEVKLFEGSAVTFGSNELTNVVGIVKGENQQNILDEISCELGMIIKALANGKGTDNRLYELEMRAKFLSSRLILLAKEQPLFNNTEDPAQPIENELEIFDWKSVINTMETKQSFNDYPKAARENAKRGIELNKEVGNKCATAVGKLRASQISQGKNLTLDILKRTYSYLSRAEEYYNPSDTKACGTISYLLWGGKPMLNYCKSKLKELNEI
jgi:HK97 family phage prohead protease